MHLSEPSWWYRSPADGIANVLQPLAALYGWSAQSRYLRGRPYKCGLPVICIGNFTAGGTGKTPLVSYLCTRLKDAGHAPVVLTRGYGGRHTGPYWVDAVSDIARDVGDEALLIARVAPTHIARDRAAGARAIETGPHRATVILMDDGLQNSGLTKDLTIAVVDGRRGLGNGLVMPAGPLRLPLALQLELTDAIMVNEPSSVTGAPVADWLRQSFAGPVLRAATVPAATTEWLKGARVVAWAGIGAPERFFGMLEALGAVVAQSVALRDHEMPGASDIARLLELARRHSAVLVSTEKDMARLAGATGAAAELAAATRVLPVRLALAEADADRLYSLVDTALQRR